MAVVQACTHVFNLHNHAVYQHLFRSVLPCVGFQVGYNIQSVRHGSTKHWNPKFKLLRKLKVVKVKLPNFQRKEDPENMSKVEIKRKLKEMGMQPPRPWSERSIFLSCTGGVLEPYVPPEGDGKISIITASGAKQKMVQLEKKSKSMLSVRKIRSYDEDFDAAAFVEEAQQIYINAHNTLAERNKEKLSDYVTEKALPEMISNIENKTIRWKFLNSLEPPRMVHCRHTDMITKNNIFVQATIRFHTQQMLAIYDRFGRLIYGSEILAKDVLEYVVFEKHLSSMYGVWRIHDKIIPDWMPKSEPSSRTYVIEPPEPESSDENMSNSSETEIIERSKQSPAIAST